MDAQHPAKAPTPHPFLIVLQLISKYLEYVVRRQKAQNTTKRTKKTRKPLFASPSHREVVEVV